MNLESYKSHKSSGKNEITWKVSVINKRKPTNTIAQKPKDDKRKLTDTYLKEQLEYI